MCYSSTKMPSQTTNHLAVIAGANIRSARLAADLTQRELADRLGAPDIYVSRWERGKNSPSPKFLPVIADVLFNGDLSALYREEAA